MSPTKVITPLQLFADVNGDRSPAYGARSTYLHKLERYQLQPLLICPTMSAACIDDLYSQASGVFFVGGSDIDPRRYASRLEPSTTVTEKQRDGLELALLRRLLADRKPFLGICRGCQALAIASGGTLLQDVPGHRAFRYSTLSDDSHHAVILDKDSRAYSLLQRESIFVTSAHHQGVQRTGPALRVAARAPDGVVEIIEHRDPSFFCFGLQSHPEVEEDGHLEPFFAEFAEQCRLDSTEQKRQSRDAEGAGNSAQIPWQRKAIDMRSTT